MWVWVLEEAVDLLKLEVEEEREEVDEMDDERECIEEALLSVDALLNSGLPSLSTVVKYAEAPEAEDEEEMGESGVMM